MISLFDTVRQRAHGRSTDFMYTITARRVCDLPLFCLWQGLRGIDQSQVPASEDEYHHHPSRFYNRFSISSDVAGAVNHVVAS